MFGIIKNNDDKIFIIPKTQGIEYKDFLEVGSLAEAKELALATGLPVELKFLGYTVEVTHA